MGKSSKKSDKTTMKDVLAYAKDGVLNPVDHFLDKEIIAFKENSFAHKTEYKGFVDKTLHLPETILKDTANIITGGAIRGDSISIKDKLAMDDMSTKEKAAYIAEKKTAGLAEEHSRGEAYTEKAQSKVKSRSQVAKEEEAEKENENDELTPADD